MANRRTYLSKAGDMFGCNLTHRPLLESLHELAIAEVEAAWGLEIERRLAQYDRGGVLNRCAVRHKPSFERTDSGSRKTQRRFGAGHFEQHIQTGWTQVRCYALRNRY